MKTAIKFLPLVVMLVLLLIHSAMFICFNHQNTCESEFYYFNFFWLLLISVICIITAFFVRSPIILRFTLLTGLLYLIFVLTTIEKLNPH